MRPLPAFALLAALALAACETPRESCVNDGLREIATVRSLVAETQGNIRRGYAIEIDQEVEVVRDTCIVELDDGTEGAVRCDRTIVDDVERPVAINIAAERLELAQLEERLARLEAEQSARVRACAAAYPE